MQRYLRLATAVLAGTLACGLPLWPIPYSQVNMPGHSSVGTWLVTGAPAGLLAGQLIRTSFRAPTLAVAGGSVLPVR